MNVMQHLVSAYKAAGVSSAKEFVDRALADGMILVNSQGRYEPTVKGREFVENAHRGESFYR